MKKRIDSWMFFVIAFTLLAAVGGQTARADNPTYTIDQAPLTPPDFNDYTVIDVKSINDLTNTETGLPGDNDKVIYRLQTSIQMTSQIKIINNKAIDLNGHTIEASKTANLLIEQANTTTKQFKLYNGKIIGGPEAASQGGNGSQVLTNTAFLNSPVSKDKHVETIRNIVIEDLTYKSSDVGGSFIIALAANIFSLGKVNVSTYNTNLRAGNMTFLGDFDGTAFGNGEQDWYGQASGGINLSFGAAGWTYINSYNYGNETMDKSNGDRRIYVAKDSHVTLTNTNNYSSSNSGRAYANNIANFAVINVDGSLICKSQGTSLQSTASYWSVGKGYDSYAGTFNGRTNIYVNPSATFEVSTLGNYNDYGVSYSYYQDFYVNAPKSFSLTYLGTYYLVYSRSDNNVYLYNQDINVWTRKDSPDATGNPTRSWSDVEWMNDLKISYGKDGTISSSNSDLEKNFAINDYSKISNVANQPVVISEETINNGDVTFSGSSNYKEYGGEIVKDKVPVGATVTLTVDNNKYTTTTDDQGKWTFSDLDFKKIAGGTTATISLTDKAGLSSEIKDITFVDTTPPVVTRKVIKVKENTTGGLDNPKQGIESAVDETTETTDLTYEYVTSEDERAAMLQKIGVYTVQVNVSDKAGNTTKVSMPVIVYNGDTEPTDGFVTGNDFSVDFNTWKKASNDDKRSIILDKGSIKGYAITDTSVEDVTNDSSQTIVTVPDATWEANGTYDVTIKVGDYSKTIKVTLTPSDVKMTIKQIYAGTDTPIYSDLEQKIPVDNTKATEVEIDGEIEAIVTKLITDKQFTLNYSGYDTKSVSSYKIYQNGNELSPTPSTVPDTDFTLVYEYTGQLKFDQVATKLDFGSVKITGKTSDTALTDSSDQKISIINTLQNNKWTLKAAVPDGITSDSNKTFLGALVYKGNRSDEQIIGSSATQIESQTDNNLYSQLNLRDNTNGLFLQQNAGNLKGSYTGTVVWTLEDSP